MREIRDARLIVPVTKEEYESAKKQAAMRGLAVATYLRQLILDDANSLGTATMDTQPMISTRKAVKHEKST